jgi:hypothetical protein
MTNRGWTRIVGGMAALILCAVMVSFILYAGVLTGQKDRVFAEGIRLPASDQCSEDCSQCRSDQVCCSTANGHCGCFPGSIQCP